ncbi:MAG: glucose 1-dehydrogenase [Chloroflexi bacterium]|nr:glucose 1-dehydrogenase [Chloroflexota bacterium]MCH8338039.1 glucose 1-dehydrogenase [Chloroflexota bacterium]MCH8340774.1 glucose 1-dehydrogenase [Chloroflexota bacterium]
MRLPEKVALITGGNSGIGLATAKLFADEGAKVMIAVRDSDRAVAALRSIGADHDQGRYVVCDVQLEDDCRGAVNATSEAFGRLDVLVNNAGIIYRGLDVVRTTLEEWDKMFAVNVRGAFLMSKFALPEMIRAGSGCIVNVASYFGLVGGKGVAAYCASKGALVQLTRAMALDHADEGVRVNCVCPGSVQTPMIDQAWAEYGDGAPELWAAKHPIGRIAQPDEVAQAILYLASSASSFVTGAALPIDGGITAG